MGTDGPALFKSIVPVIAVAQALVSQMLAQGGQSALDAVARSEYQLDRFESYWPTGVMPETTAAKVRSDASDQSVAESDVREYRKADKVGLPGE